MSTKSVILLGETSAEAGSSAFSYSTKQVGAGYHKKNGGLHTYTYEVEAFSGSIKLQGSLESYPGDADWIDIVGTNEGGDSTISNEITVYTGNFTGNFVWIRAAYNLENGKIVQIRYNY